MREDEQSERDREQRDGDSPAPTIGRAARPHQTPPATRTKPPTARTPVNSATPNPATKVAAATSGTAARGFMDQTVPGAGELRDRSPPHETVVSRICV